MTDSSSENAPTVNDCLRMLTRRSVPDGQVQLYQALLVAGAKGATTAELVSTMGRRDAKDLSGVLGALGNRINGTPGYGESQKPGIGMILRWNKVDEGWRYHLKPVMQEALAAHAPPWLPDTATSRWIHLVDLVRSRFPGWLGFEDPRFNEGPLDEVGYKFATAQEAKKQISEPELRRLVHAEEYEEVVDRLIQVGTDNNLLWNNQPQGGDLQLLYHDGLDRAGYCGILLDLLYGEGDTPDRLDRYVRWVSSQDLDSMNRWALPTYFLFFLDIENEIFVKPQSTRNLLKLGGSNVRFDAKPTGEDYARIRDAYRELHEAVASYRPRHMIDVQSFGWVAQEEADRQRKARQKAKAEGFVLDSRVEERIKEFERTTDAAKLNRSGEPHRASETRFRRGLRERHETQVALPGDFLRFLQRGGRARRFEWGILPQRPVFEGSQHSDLSAISRGLADPEGGVHAAAPRWRNPGGERRRNVGHRKWCQELRCGRSNRCECTALHSGPGDSIRRATDGEEGGEAPRGRVPAPGVGDRNAWRTLRGS